MHHHLSNKTVHRPDWPLVRRGVSLVLIVLLVLVLC